MFNLLKRIRELEEAVDVLGKENTSLVEENVSLKSDMDSKVESCRRDIAHANELEIQKIKANLEVRFQERLTELQEKFFKDAKEMFQKEVNVLRETYKSLIESII